MSAVGLRTALNVYVGVKFHFDLGLKVIVRTRTHTTYRLLYRATKLFSKYLWYAWTQLQECVADCCKLLERGRCKLAMVVRHRS